MNLLFPNKKLVMSIDQCCNLYFWILTGNGNIENLLYYCITAAALTVKNYPQTICPCVLISILQYTVLCTVTYEVCIFGG